MLKIGLTGGIGSGKTTVANYFQELGACIIDSDAIAHELINKGEPAYTSIIQRFNDNIQTNNGDINRKELRQIIFTSPLEKKWLEELLHPLIKRRIQDEALCSQSVYCIVVIPLLVETKSFDLVDRVLVVDSSVEHQIQRTIERDGSNKNIIDSIINNQATREERIAVANEIIYNNHDLNYLKKKVLELHQFYLHLINTD